jgi:phosphoglycolate phosphatase
MDLKLVIFDVDGTLVGSQEQIVAAMRAAFAARALPCPPRQEILSIVGLSLPVAMARLRPQADPAAVAALVAAYRALFADRSRRIAAPLFPGAAAALARIAARDDVLLCVATGKSRRGLDRLLAEHGLQETFLTLQTADDHPSKPHPAMVEAALRETGVTRVQAAMIGDTSFDMEMARAAGVAAIGVAWGYHSVLELHAAGAATVLTDFGGLDGALASLWAEAA